MKKNSKRPKTKEKKTLKIKDLNTLKKKKGGMLMASRQYDEDNNGSSKRESEWD